jgi:hypothetical protein
VGILACDKSDCDPPLVLPTASIGTLDECKNSEAGLVDPAFRFRTGSCGLVSTERPSVFEITELWL